MSTTHAGHPSSSRAEEGRHLVRPRLAPFASIAQRQATSGDSTAPVGESHNCQPSDVLLQGFHWTSCQSRAPTWWQIVEQNAASIQKAQIDGVWLPPPSESVNPLGYMPTRWSTYDSAYGTKQQLVAAIAALGPVRAIADVVVNHRCGIATGGADFDGPPFDLHPDQSAAICRDDECGSGTGELDTGENQIAGRDLDHTNPVVQDAVRAYLAELQALGFRGFRFDEARGYAGSFVRMYIATASPYLSVGEFWDGAPQNVIDWIDSTRGTSMAFDFPTRTLLRDALARRQFAQLKTVGGKPAGAIGLWPAMCVTFLENHDTDKDSAHPDEFGPGDAVVQGYAYLLTHPGVPCIFWPHYFDYGDDIRARIDALIALRKARGVNRASIVDIVAADEGRYAAVIDDTVAMKIGPGPWSPGDGWKVAADGNDYAVWIRD